MASRTNSQQFGSEPICIHSELDPIGLERYAFDVQYENSAKYRFALSGFGSSDGDKNLKYLPCVLCARNLQPRFSS